MYYNEDVNIILWVWKDNLLSNSNLQLTGRFILEYNVVKQNGYGFE